MPETAENSGNTEAPTSSLPFIEEVDAPTYHISFKDGEGYLKFKDEDKSVSGDGGGETSDCKMFYSVTFASLAEMRETFMEGRLEERVDKKQLETFRTLYPRDDAGRIIIPDMNRLWSPTLPGDISVKNCCTGGRMLFV